MSARFLAEQSVQTLRKRSRGMSKSTVERGHKKFAHDLFLCCQLKCAKSRNGFSIESQDFILISKDYSRIKVSQESFDRELKRPSARWPFSVLIQVHNLRRGKNLHVSCLEANRIYWSTWTFLEKSLYKVKTNTKRAYFSCNYSFNYTSGKYSVLLRLLLYLKFFFIKKKITFSCV